MNIMNIIQKIVNSISWKYKAVMRNLELKRQKKRIKELEISRNKWKNKAMERQKIIEELEKRNQEVEKELKKN
jgi:hypothetical protein